MKRRNLLLAAISLFAFLPAMAADEKGFVPLFDGKTMDGWHNPYKSGKIEIVDGEIHLTGNSKFFVVTDKKYSDFIFEGEVLLPKGNANSGFLFRAIEEPGKVYGYQAEVDGNSKRNWSGGLYDEGRRMWFASPIKNDEKSVAAFRERAGDAFKRNDWNTYRITCKGDSITIEVNGVVTSQVTDDMDSSGVIGIQHHGEKGQTYKFRNLRIKELD